MKKSLLFLITSLMGLSTHYVSTVSTVPITTVYVHTYTNNTDNAVILLTISYVGTYGTCNQDKAVRIEKGKTVRIAKSCRLAKVEWALPGNPAGTGGDLIQPHLEPYSQDLVVTIQSATGKNSSCTVQKGPNDSDSYVNGQWVPQWQDNTKWWEKDKAKAAGG